MNTPKEQSRSGDGKGKYRQRIKYHQLFYTLSLAIGVYQLHLYLQSYRSDLNLIKEFSYFVRGSKVKYSASKDLKEWEKSQKYPIQSIVLDRVYSHPEYIVYVVTDYGSRYRPADFSQELVEKAEAYLKIIQANEIPRYLGCQTPFAIGLLYQVRVDF